MSSSGSSAIACNRSSLALRRMRWGISSAIDEPLVDRQRAAVDLGLWERVEHLRQRHRPLDRVRQDLRGPAALVACEPAPVEPGVGLDFLGAQDELDALAGPGVGDGVAAALEAEESVAGDHAGGALDDHVGRRRDRPERRVVALGAGGDAFAVGAVHALARDVVIPGRPGVVGVLVAAEAVGAQQPLADVGDVRLDLALGLRPIGLAQAQREAVVMRRGERLGMKLVLAQRALAADMGADDGLGAVIEQLARNTAEMRERRAVTRPEGDQVLRTGQRAERVARMAEDHVKAIERQLQARAGHDRVLMGPVDLRLMTGPRLKALLLARGRPRPRALDVAADRVVAALKAVIAGQVLMDPRRQQARRGRQPLVDQRLELIQLARHPPPLVDRLRPGLQIALHRPPIAAQQSADLGVRVPLARQRPRVHQLLLVDHRRSPRRSTTHRPRASPRPQTEPPTPRVGQDARTRVTGDSPLRGSSPITRVASLNQPPDRPTRFGDHRPTFFTGHRQLWERVPDESTVRKLVRRLGAEVIEEICEWVIAEATSSRAGAQRFVVRAARIDSTIVEADVRYPTDLGLAQDAARALAREALKARGLVGASRARVTDRSRAIAGRLRRVNRSVAGRTGQSRALALRLTGAAGALLAAPIREARRLAAGLRERARGRGAGAKPAAAERLECLCELAARVCAQIGLRLTGQPISDRLVSISDPDARPIRKGQLNKPTEFGYVMQLSELCENTRRGARGLILPASTG